MVVVKLLLSNIYFCREIIIPMSIVITNSHKRHINRDKLISIYEYMDYLKIM